MPFTGPKLSVQEHDDCQWLLTAPLHYQGRVDHYTVPSGFLTDFATVPKRLQGIVQATGRWTKAAVLHDWLCTEGIRCGLITSRDADGIFRRVMREEGVGFATRWCMWAAVRWAAFANPLRRPGTWRDLPLMVPITAAVLSVAWGIACALHALDHLVR